MLSDERIGDYYTGVRRVLTNIFGSREVLAYVTSTEKTGGTRKLLSYQGELFAVFRNESVQEFRFALSGQIRAQIFYTTLVKNIETSKNSDWLIKALKQVIQQRGIHL